MRKKLGSIVLNTVLVMAILLVAATVFATLTSSRQDVNLFGYKPFLLSSESMSPSYEKFGLVVIKKGGYEDVSEGDVVAFKASSVGGAPAFHRVESISSEGFVTKGDANEYRDGQIVTESDFIGHEVFHTNFTAKIVPFFSSPRGCLFAAVVLLFTIMLIVTVSKLRRLR